MHGVSYDYSKAQQVEAFVQFLELLSKPEELAKLFADIKSAQATAEAAISAKTKVDDVDNYVKRCEADIDAKYTKIETQMADSKKLAQELERNQADFRAMVEAKEKEFRVRAGKITEQEKALSESQAAVTKLQAELEEAKAVAKAAEAAAKELAQSFLDKEAALKRALAA